MNKSKRFFLPLLILAIVVSAVIFFWPQVYAYLIDPTVRIFWLVIRMFLAIDQQIYWIFLIFAVFILFALMIPVRQEGYRTAYKKEQPPAEDPVTNWKDTIDLAKENPDARQALQHRMEELQKKVVSLMDGDEEGKAILSSINQDPKSSSRSLSRVLLLRNASSKPDWMKNIEDTLILLEQALEIKNDKTNEPPDRE